jgi:hypothetical protein
MRNIFHAWGDAKCVEILLNIKAGMTEQSVLIIDEIAFPEKNAKGQAAEHDIEVMICVGRCPELLDVSSNWNTRSLTDEWYRWHRTH